MHDAKVITTPLSTGESPNYMMEALLWTQLNTTKYLAPYST